MTICSAHEMYDIVQAKCVCDMGYIRDPHSGACVLPSEIPTGTQPVGPSGPAPGLCPPREMFDMVQAKCVCDVGYARHPQSGYCVLPHELPAHPTAPAYMPAPEPAAVPVPAYAPAPAYAPVQAVARPGAPPVAKAGIVGGLTAKHLLIAAGVLAGAYIVVRVMWPEPEEVY